MMLSLILEGGRSRHEFYGNWLIQHFLPFGEKENILHEVSETANGLAQLNATARPSDNTGIAISVAALVSFFLLIGA